MCGQVFYTCSELEELLTSFSGQSLSWHRFFLVSVFVILLQLDILTILALLVMYAFPFWECGWTNNPHVSSRLIYVSLLLYDSSRWFLRGRRLHGCTKEGETMQKSSVFVWERLSLTSIQLISLRTHSDITAKWGLLVAEMGLFVDIAVSIYI